MNHRFVLLAQKYIKTPRFLWQEPELDVQARRIPGYRGGEIEVFIIALKDLPLSAPCFVNFHSGGFVFEGYNSHYKMAIYAKEGHCKVVYVHYRLAPAYPFPYPQWACYAALVLFW